MTGSMSAGVVAIPTLFWIWRTRTIRNILSDVGEIQLKKNWQMPLLLGCYGLSVIFYLSGLSFTYFTFPQALGNFIIGLYFINCTRTSLRKKGSFTPTHILLLVTVFVIYAHALNLPFLRYQNAFADLGFLIVLLTTILMAIVLPAVTIYELQRDQQKALEKIIKDRVKQLTEQAKFSALGEMTAGIVHEIKNPLSIIMHRSSHLRSQVIKDAADKEMLMRNLDQIEITTDRMVKIVNSLRKFSRDSTTNPLQVVAVATIIEDTLGYCSDRFYHANILLQVEPYPVCNIECKSVQISQVILNLFNNSFDAIKGSANPWVKVDFIEKEKSFQIRVTDSGTGIPSQVRKRIMEPFFTTKTEGGTGLGLSISREIVEAHHGIFFYDEASINTTFVVELPYHQSTAIL